MMLDKIKEPVSREIANYEEYLKHSLHIGNKLVQAMLDHIFDTQGKAIRPLMVLLGGAMYSHGEPLPEESYMAAMLIEMVHTASLVHDDVIDEASIRRGKPSVNALWHSRRAVIIGDYILAKSYSVGMGTGAYNIVGYIADCMSDLCEGELIQSDQSDRLEMTREIYSDIIYKKTATLLGASCGVGAMSVNAPEGEIRRMKEIGDSIGMAFQIKDDILDYTQTVKTGKPVCGDLHEKKITLPLLTILEKSSPARKSEIIGLLSDIRDKPKNADLLYRIVIDEKGLEMAAAEMDKYVAKARTLLETCPASAYRNSMNELFSYITQRDM